MVETVTDEQLIHSYQKGEADAFEALYIRYKNAIYHYFFRQVHSSGTADELHQDVWLKIIKSSSAFKRQSSFKTWLYKIAHNRLIDHYRQSSRQPLYLVQPVAQADSLTEGTTAANKITATSDKPSNEPDAALQEQQLCHALLKGISALPEAQKEVFLLHEKSGLTLQEIALITGSSFESTKSRLRYAVKKLRLHMTQDPAVQPMKNVL